jgi:hypothetical protein
MEGDGLSGAPFARGVPPRHITRKFSARLGKFTRGASDPGCIRRKKVCTLDKTPHLKWAILAEWHHDEYHDL